MRLCTFVVTLRGTIALCSNSAKRRSTGWIPSTIGPTGLCMLSKGADCKSAGMSGGVLSALQAHPQMRSWHIIYRCICLYKRRSQEIKQWFIDQRINELLKSYLFERNGSIT